MQRQFHYVPARGKYARQKKTTAFFISLNIKTNQVLQKKFLSFCESYFSLNSSEKVFAKRKISKSFHFDV